MAATLWWWLRNGKNSKSWTSNECARALPIPFYSMAVTCSTLPKWNDWASFTKASGAEPERAGAKLPVLMQPIDVAAGLVFRDGQLLLTQRAAGAHLAGLWEFPGGKREPGETFEDCLAREL